jgi:hypothetical protein
MDQARQQAAMISFLDTAQTVTRVVTSRSVQRTALRLAPLVILLLACALRFYNIGTQSLWNDEGNSLRLAERVVPDLIAAARLDIHPPGYYIALKGWIAALGETEFALRAFSALAGVLTVAFVYALGKSLFAPGAGVVAALLVAINSFNVYYSQEARMYALLALWAAAALWSLSAWLKADPSRRLLLAVLLIVFNAAGLYTQYVFPFVMLTQGVMFVVWWLPHRDRARLLDYIAINALILIIFLPQASDAIRQVTSWPRTGQPVDPITGLTTVAEWLIFGNTAGRQLLIAYFWPALFCVAALLPDWRRNRLPGWWRRSLPIVWIVLSVAPFFAIGLFREANLKFLLPAQIAVALLIGRGAWLLWEIGSPNLFLVVEALPRIAAFFGLMALWNMNGDALNNLYNSSLYIRSDYRAMAARIAANARPGDAIVLDAPNQREVFTYYYHGDDPIFALPAGLGGDDVATTRSVDSVIMNSHRIFVLYWGETERDPNRIVQKELADHTFEANSIWYSDVRFVQYAIPPTTTGTPITINARFGPSIVLKNVALSSTTVTQGDVIGITLDWTTDATLSKRYKVFIHVLDSGGNLVAQRDSEPGNNLEITTTWQPGIDVIDKHGLLIPTTAATGDYRLILGLYDMDDPTTRLKIGDTSTDDHVELGTIHVQSEP